MYLLCMCLGTPKGNGEFDKAANSGTERSHKKRELTSRRVETRRRVQIATQERERERERERGRMPLGCARWNGNCYLHLEQQRASLLIERSARECNAIFPPLPPPLPFCAATTPTAHSILTTDVAHVHLLLPIPHSHGPASLGFLGLV